MIFPLDIKRNIRLSYSLKGNQKEIALRLILEEFKKLKVDKFEKDEKSILFVNRFGNGQGRNHIFAAIDRGTINCKENYIQITFSTRRMAIITFIMASFTGFISKSFFTGFLVFSLLYGLNVFIFLIRSNILKKRLKKEIEKQKLNSMYGK